MLSACGTSALDPVLTFTSSATSVSVGSLVTLSWESQHARYCSATGDWSDLKDTSGSEEVTISAVGYSNFVLTCVGDTGEPAVSSIRIEGVGMINGKLVDGYIRGASIFVDENQNGEGPNTNIFQQISKIFQFVPKRSKTFPNIFKNFPTISKNCPKQFQQFPKQIQFSGTPFFVFLTKQVPKMGPKWGPFLRRWT